MTARSQSTVASVPKAATAWRERLGLGLSGLAILFFLVDAVGKLLEIEPVMRGTTELGWPISAVVPLGVLLLLGALLYALPRTSVLGAIYLTGFLGGTIAMLYRIGSPLFTHAVRPLCGRDHVGRAGAALPAAAGSDRAAGAAALIALDEGSKEAPRIASRWLGDVV